MKGLVDPRGHMPAAVAIASTVSALLKLGQAVECSHSKKLEHLLELKSAGLSSRVSHMSVRSSGSFRSMKANGSAKPCAVCSTTLHLFRSVAHCELCSKAVCSRCRVTRRLSYCVGPKALKQKNTIFCTSCVARGSAYSAADVARASQTSAKKTALNGLNSLVSRQPRRFQASSTRSSNYTVLSSSTYSRLETSVEEDGEEAQRRGLRADANSGRVRRRSLTHPAVLNDKEKLADLDLTISLSVVSSSMDDDLYESEEGRRKTQPPSAFSDLPECEPVDPLGSSMPPKPSASAMASQLRRQRELMRRMEELRQNAESVYQLTWRNTQSMQLQSQSVCAITAEMDIELD